MKEDILEQIAEDYFLSQPGFFTKCNLKFRPDTHKKWYNPKTDSVHSDIDVVAINAQKLNSIKVVNCKSWQSGLNFKKFQHTIKETISSGAIKTIGKRDFWNHFRELCSQKWTDGFITTLRNELNNQGNIIIDYTILCTKLANRSNINLKQQILELEKSLRSYYRNIDNKVDFNFNIKTIDTYVNFVLDKINKNITTAVENTHLSRTLQLLLASNHKIIKSDLLTLKSFNPYNCTRCEKEITKKDKKYYCTFDWFITKEVICNSCLKKDLNNKKCSCGKKYTLLN